MAIENNRNTVLTIGTTAQIVSEEVQEFSGEMRKVISLVNSSTDEQVITIAIGGSAAVGQGIPLSPGGFYQESVDAGFKPTQSFITAISDTPDAKLSIQERKVQK